MVQIEVSKAYTIMNKKKSVLEAKTKMKISKHGPVYEAANKEFHTATLKHTLITEKSNAISKLVHCLLDCAFFASNKCQDYYLH